MTVHKNMLEQYLEEFFEALHGRQIVILGCRGVSAVVYCAVKAMGHDILYFLNPESYDKEHMNKTEYFGKPVLPCHQILYENPEEIAILNTYHYTGRIELLLRQYGLEENVHYYNLNDCLKSEYCGVFDPLLGYSRMDDLYGIKVFGKDGSNALKIIALGGSTTDFSFSGVKSWPLLFHELLLRKGIENVVYNAGICGYSSCQERDKLIRDILGFAPDMVIALTGVNDINWTLVCGEAPFYAKYFVDKMAKSIYHCDNILSGDTAHCSDYDNWLHNEKIMHGVACEFGIRFYSFLQPIIFQGQYQMSAFEHSWMELFLARAHEHPSMQQLYEGQACFYRGARTAMRGKNFMFDITDAFDEASGVYTDGVHCDETGNALLAKAIYGKLAGIGEFT